MGDREEKRRLLRQKIAARRAERTGGTASASTIATQVRNDPASALLALGVDDAAVLSQASAALTGMNTEALRSVARSAKRASRRRGDAAEGGAAAEEAPPLLPASLPPRRETFPGFEEDEEDEEAPPPVAPAHA